ncbi:MAG: Cyanophage [Pseudomonadota bacterium]|jgi:hypothetical protein
MHNYFDVDALSASGAKKLLQSPAHFKVPQGAPTPAMVTGTVVHGLVLEPHRQDLYVVKRMNWATKDGKLEREALESTGLPIISEADEAMALRIRDAVYANKRATELLDEARAFILSPESEIYWSGYLSGVACKAKLDACTENTILDLKTCVNASPDAFAKQIATFQYHMQAKHYLNGVEAELGYQAPKQFTFIAVEKTAPFAVGLYTIDRTALLMGQAKMERAALIYSRCRATDTWPAYEPEVVQLSLPAWAHDENPDEFDDRECDF